MLTYYKTYRALVRAKVDALRVSQEKTGADEYRDTYADFLQYLDLAEKYTRTQKPFCLINYGLSGSGKSVGSRMLLEKIPAIQVRSDIERKRLFGVLNQSESHADIGQGIYTPDANQKTYARLACLARTILESGYSVIIDAANLQMEQRRIFIDLAVELDVPVIVLEYYASPETLRKRVRKRAAENMDASDATLDVLESQLKKTKPIQNISPARHILIDTEDGIDIEFVLSEIQGCLQNR